MPTRALLLSVIAAAASVAGVGCGGTYYAISAGIAQSKLEEARSLDAETKAPYEYHYAKAHLDQAAVEASEASYSDAAEYAEIAEQYAIKAIDAVKAGKSR